MGYKQAQRREDDIAIVNAGMFVSFQHETCIVKDVALSYGGMAPTTIMALNTAKKMKGRYGIKYSKENERSVDMS